MKLLLIQPLTYLLTAGGAHKANRIVIEGLAARGHTCQVIAATGVHTAFVPHTEFCDELTARGIEIVAASEQAVVFRHNGVEVHALPDTFQMFTYVTERMRTFAPDWTLVSEDRSCLFFEAALKASPARVIYVSHSQSTLPFGPESFVPDPTKKPLFAQAASILAASHYIKGCFEREGLDATVIPFPSYGPGPFPALGQFERGYVTMTNPSAIKGISIFLELARALPETPFAAVPTWATRQSDRAALRELSNVTLLPATEQIDDIFAQTRVLLTPSLWGEAFGQIVIDAMLRGIPVLASAVGGLPEAKLGVPYVLPVAPIQRYEETLDELRLPIPIVPEQNITPWLNTLTQLLTDRALYEELAAASRAAALAFVKQTGIAPFEQFLEQRAAVAQPDHVAAAAASSTSSARDRLQELSPERRALLARRAQQRQRTAAPAPSAPKIPRRDLTQPALLSFAQQRLWFLDQLQPGNTAYNELDAIRLTGPLDLDALQRSFSAIVERHEVLRTTFGLSAGQPVQQIQLAQPVPIPLYDVQRLPADEQQAALQQRARSAAAQPFDLSRDLLLRVAVVRLAADDHVLLWTAHHIALDGWSAELLKQELAHFYTVYHTGASGAALAPLPIQYADFAAWQRRWFAHGQQTDQLKYWQQQLADAPGLQLPTDHARPAQFSYRGARHRFALPETQAAALKALSQQEGATLFMTLLALFQMLLQRYSGQDDIAVGTPIAGRTQVEVERLIGLFVNTLVLRADLSGDPSFRSLLQQVRATCLAAYAHQDVPFDQVVDLLQPERDLSRNPLFQVSLVLHNGQISTLRLAGLTSHPFEAGEPAAKLDLTLILLDGADGLSGWVEYCRDLFEPTTIARFVTHFQMLIAGVLAQPDQPISRIALLTPEDRAVVIGRQHTDAVARNPLAAQGWLPSLFEAQAAHRPEAVALVEGTQQLSYQQLNRRANQLAHRLQQLGVRPETRVAVYLPRSIDLVVSLLAILKAGGVYVPLDPDYPEARLQFMLADSAAEVLLTWGDLRAGLPAFAGSVAALDEDAALLDAQSSANLPPTALGHNLAYVIYTSGSTGQPKGVGVSYATLTSHCKVIERAWELSAQDRVLQFASPSFDVSLEQMLPTLLSGACLALRAAELWSPQEFAEYIDAAALTVINLPPVYWREWVQIVAQNRLAAPAQLRLVIVGGDVLTPETAELWQSTPLRDLRLLNAYGPTEATITATVFDLTSSLHDAAARRSIPIGRALAERSAYILDRSGAPTPIGVPGELCLGGALLARGYLNQPALTAERFVPDPFGADDPARSGARLYRTGDLARWLPDGAIEMLGRIDEQVKVRGFRIEIGEIESALAAHPAVAQALVVVRSDLNQAQRLVAYVATGEQGAENQPANEPTNSGSDIQDSALSPARSMDARLQPSALRQFLAQRLPGYMVPAAFVLLPQLPLLPSGKVDRRALPAPDWADSASAAGLSAPRSPVEVQLAQIWAQVLGVAQVGVHDNFFECGGDSISSIQVVTRAREAGIRLTPKQLFEYQTIAELALVADSGPLIQAEQGLIVGDAPLTPIQVRFFEQNFAEPQHWNLPLLVEMDGELSAAQLAELVRALLWQHDALRARFVRDERGWRQTFDAPAAQPPCAVIDLAGLPEAAQAAAITRAASELQTQLDITDGPLLRVALFTLGAGRPSRLLLAIHHLVVDSVSWRIILEDAQTLVQQLRQNRPQRLPAKTSSFKHWAEQLAAHAQSPALQQELRSWLAALPTEATPLPRDLPDGANLEATAATVTVTLTSEATRALVQQAPAAYNTQINDLLLAALALGCAPWLGGAALLVDIEGHGREPLFDDADLSRTVGWFTTISPVFLDAGSAAEPGAVIKRIKERLRQMPQRGIGYGLLRYLSADPTTATQLRARPQAEILFNYLGQLDQQLASAALFRPATEPMGPMHGLANRRSHLIEINALVRDGQLQMAWTYSDQLHRRATIEQLAQAVVSQLQTLIAHCVTPGVGGATPSDFPLLQLTQTQLDQLIAQTGPIADLYPLTPAQQGMLFHSEYAPGSGVYIGQMVGTLAGALSSEAFSRAWQTALDSHASLRSAFSWEQLDTPVQVVQREVRLSIIEHDWREVAPAEQQARLASYLLADRQRDFKLGEAPLLRVSLVRLADDLHQFVWTSHHMLLDGWSTGLVFQDVLRCYEAFRRNEQPALTRSRPYRDYIAWLQRQDMNRAEAFWRDQLSGVSAPTPLPLSTTSSAARGVSYREEALRLPSSTTAALTQQARQRQLTLSTLMQAAWALLLSHTTQQPDVVFGMTVAGRPAEVLGVERMIGLFINTLPVRVRTPQTMAALAWLQQLQAQQVELRQYEYSPLVQVQRWSDLPPGQPLFETIVVFDNYPDDPSAQERQPSLVVRDLAFFEQTHYPLTCMITPGDELTIRLSYDTSIFDAVAISRLLDCLHTIVGGLLTALEGGSVQRVGDITPLSAFERRLLHAWNATEVDYGAAQTLPQLIEAQVARTPEAIALADRDQELSYRELNARANRLAHELRRRGVRPETLVGICLERSADLIIALVAVLKAGGAYVPLDPSYPPERLRFMLHDAHIPLLLTHRQLAATLPTGATEVLDLDQERVSIAAASADNPCSGVTADHLAYMIYTSGSTGQPKGAMNTHRGIYNRLRWMQAAYQLDETDRVLQKTPMSFDVSVWEFFWPLITGARMIVAQPGGHQDPAYLVELIAAQQVTTVHFVPAMLQVFIEEPDVARCTSLKRVICSGEALPLDLQTRFFERLPAELHNLYGPTEAAVDVTAWACRADPALRTVPIGYPIANTQIHLLDAQLHPAPVGVTAELYIGGVQVARGYHGRPALTAEKFIPDPFSTQPGARLYRTGDLARHLPDGAIEYLGRIDHQIKVRGFRIELGEIEATLASHAALREAVVLARTDGSTGAQLIGYVVPHAENSLAHGELTGELRSFLRQTLPEYMVPAAFVALPALPLLPNGKIDRRTLAQHAPAAQIAAETAYVAPRTPIEEALAGVWAEILNQERVGVHDSFFALGGHSLLATQVIARVRRMFQIALPLRTVFEAATIAEFAEVMLAHEPKPGQTLKIALILKQIDQLSADQVRHMLQHKGKS
jgi:amino acid adenylation domain-containing protein/non-ribosomal peptide synthase protein (TIGR01720 family)